MFRKFTNDYASKANHYADHQIEGTLLLAYREFGSLFSRYVNEGNRALDFGCGTGRSTKYLKSVGFIAQGVDIDPSMIAKSRSEDEHGTYQLIEDNKIPQRDSYYDLVFSTLVLLEIPSLEQMQSTFEDIYRTMKFNGTFIVLTVNDDFYTHDWASVDTNYPENKGLKSGNKARIRIKEIDLELDDYYWTREDYKKIAEKAGFTVVEELLPKADEEDSNSPWISEREFSPYVIFVMKKTMALIPIQEKIASLGLQPLPGKGYFKEIERSNEVEIQCDLSTELDKERNKFSKTLLLMQPNDQWQFHKLKSEETLEHIEGRDINLHLIYETGKYEKKYIGAENDNSVRKFIIPAGTWFAEEFDGQSGYSLVSATNTPGFHPDDVQEADGTVLMDIIGNDEEAAIVIGRLSNSKKSEPALRRRAGV